MPLVSVVIPMKNAEPYVREAVESVLKQEGVELEVIVVEDGSTDQSEAVVRSIDDPRIRIIPGPQKGIAAAFNAGLTEAKGEFVARCDADDVFPPGRLAWLLPRPAWQLRRPARRRSLQPPERRWRPRSARGPRRPVPRRRPERRPKSGSVYACKVSLVW